MFGRAVTLFTLFGFKVRMDWSWLIIAVLLTWSLATGFFPRLAAGLTPAAYLWMGAAGTLGLFGSIILHELGHAVIARQNGIPMRGVTLFIFGGVAEMGGSPPSAKSEFLMTVAGPIVSIVLVGIFFGLRLFSEAVQWPIPIIGVLAYLGWINFVVVVFNLVPAFPLDGGRMLRSILWAWKKDLRWATRIASGIGTGFAFLLMAWGILNFVTGNLFGGMWMFLLGLFLRAASLMSYQQVLAQQVLTGEPISRFMTSQPITVPPALSIQNLVDDFVYKYPFKMFPVVEDNSRLLGCVTIERVRQVPKEEWPKHTVGEFAIPCSPTNTIEPDADAIKALSAMNETQSSRLMVVDHDRLIGIVALKDLMNFFMRKTELEPA